MKASRVTIKYCKDKECAGHKGPGGTHAHFLVYSDGGEELSDSPAFGSRKAGEALTRGIVPDDDAADGDSTHLISLLRTALSTADLPQTADGDEEWAREVEEAKSKPRVRVIDVVVIGSGLSALLSDLVGGEHGFERRIEHGKYGIMLKGCEECGTSVMAFYVDGNYRGHANGVRTVENALIVLDQAVKAYEMTDEDATALRAKLFELFPAKSEAPPPAP